MTARSQVFDPEDLLKQVDWLRSLAAGLVFEPSVVEDVVQDTLLAAIERNPSSRFSLRPWLARVLRNIVSTRTTRRQRRLCRELDAASTSESSPPVDSVHARFETHRAVAEEVQALQEPYRELILLRYYDGLSAVAIAKRRRTPASTIRSQLCEGRKRLRRALDRTWAGDRTAWTAALVPFFPTNNRSALGASSSSSVPAGLWALGICVGGVLIVGTYSILSGQANRTGSSQARAGPSLGGRDDSIARALSTPEAPSRRRATTEPAAPRRPDEAPALIHPKAREILGSDWFAKTEKFV